MSPSSDQVEPYLQLAEQLVHQPHLKNDLSQLVLALPTPNQKGLDQLLVPANQASLSQPKRAWGIMAVWAKATQSSSDLWLEAISHWHLARLANEWVHPQRVQEAAAHAKAIFQKLGASAWVWACEWQAHALPWTSPNFGESAQILAKAVAGIQQTSALLQWLPYAHLSLAYAYLLTNQLNSVRLQLSQAEEIFQTGQDYFGLARCYLTYSSYLRRQQKFSEAYTYLNNAQQLFMQLDSPIYQAMGQFQQAFLEMNAHGHYNLAETIFRQAQFTFSQAEMPLWVAMCHNGLFQLQQTCGQMAAAQQSLEKARQIYTHYPVLGLQTDNLLDSGRFELYRGNYHNSLAYFQQAEQLYRSVGHPPSVIVSQMNQGEVYFLLGQYQKGLQLVEVALSYFETEKQGGRVVESLLILAKMGYQLGQYGKVHNYLDRAIAFLPQQEHTYYLSQIYHWRAAALFAEERLEEALTVLQNELEVAQTQSMRRQMLVAQRLLAEVLCACHRFAEAQPYLAEATTASQELGMSLDWAECELVNGHYYWQQGKLEAAQTAWQQALSLGEGLALDISWQAHTGLASLAKAVGDLANALENYSLAVGALTKLRRQMWQPALIGTYLRKPAFLFDQAVELATQTNQPELALLFIETSKAQTVAQRLLGRGGYQRLDESAQWNELLNLGQEIRWLQEQLRTSLNRQAGLIRPTKEKQLRLSLKEKAIAYDHLLERLERAGDINGLTGGLGEFDLTYFRQLAGEQLGDDWVALDYYVTDQGVRWALVTPNSSEVGWREMPAHIRFILASVRESAGKFAHLSPTDRLHLGKWLFPEQLSYLLNPHSHFLIAPHRWLHQLPWSALFFTDNIPLVAVTIPTIVPSLHTLILLWQRLSHRQSTSHNPPTALLLAPTDFAEGRHPSLPAVSAEINWLANHLGTKSKILQGTEASWHGLQTINQPLSQFDFWHIATHAFHDPETGRLSGLAFHDTDIWLDELQTLAPFPPLVTLSACSGIQQRIYVGDEPIGLSVSCLEAGAQTVVGSLWLTADTDSQQFMQQFYTHWFRGRDSAQALAKAQRTVWDQGWDWSRWGGFRCVGQPN